MVWTSLKFFINKACDVVLARQEGNQGGRQMLDTRCEDGCTRGVGWTGSKAGWSRILIHSLLHF